MKIIIAPNAFKGSLKASEAAIAIEEGLNNSNLEAEWLKIPIADGGDGTMQVLVDLLKGSVMSATVEDPLGRPIEAAFGLIDNGQTAVIEMASASGITLMHHDERNPLVASSYGTGQLICKALEQKVSHVIVTLGGSATVDGGLGILQALGLVAKDDSGKEIGKGGGQLANIKSIDTNKIDTLIGKTSFTFLCDVDNKLLGKDGAAAVFGPQKGANADMVTTLEKGLAHFAQLTKTKKGIDVATTKHGGAAGGAGAFLAAYLGGNITEGSSYLMEKSGIEAALAHAHVLITAEGSIDKQTLHGKGPYAVAKKAKAKGLITIALAGQVAPDLDTNKFTAFDAILPIAAGPVSLAQAMNDTRINLIRTAKQVGNLLSAAKK